MAAENYKIYNGTVDEFHAWLIALSEDYSEAGIKKYNDIKNSVVYISEDFGDVLPEDLSHFDGAIYANGAIIKGSSLKWDNSNVQKYPPV